LGDIVIGLALSGEVVILISLGELIKKGSTGSSTEGNLTKLAPIVVCVISLLARPIPNVLVLGYNTVELVNMLLKLLLPPPPDTVVQIVS
jgi:hypothetical protein